MRVACGGKRERRPRQRWRRRSHTAGGTLLAHTVHHVAVGVLQERCTQAPPALVVELAPAHAALEARARAADGPTAQVTRRRAQLQPRVGLQHVHALAVRLAPEGWRRWRLEVQAVARGCGRRVGHQWRRRMHGHVVLGGCREGGEHRGRLGRVEGRHVRRRHVLGLRRDQHAALGLNRCVGQALPALVVDLRLAGAAAKALIHAANGLVAHLAGRRPERKPRVLLQVVRARGLVWGVGAALERP